MRTINVWLCACAMALGAGVLSAATGATSADADAKVRKALAKVPYYGVFDLLAFKVDGGVVTLQGYAHRPSLKREAGDMVHRATGLDVANEIEVLPTNDFDDRIRWDVYQRVYTDDFADRYVSGGRTQIRDEIVTMLRFPGMEPYANYPVHIIVKHRQVTLIGSVLNDFDKTTLLIRARQTPNTSGVDDAIMVRTRG